MILIGNVAPNVDIAGLAKAAAISLFDISDVIQFPYHDKLNVILQLIKNKSKDLQKLLKYFNLTTTFVSDVLFSSCVLSIIFVLYFDAIYPITISSIIFIGTIIQLSSMIIAQNS